MRYLVIETFLHGAAPVYARAAERGRMLPPGVTYVDSWVDARTLGRCFQLMDADDPALLERWIAAWQDLVRFEVVPVIASAEAAARARAASPSERAAEEGAAGPRRGEGSRPGEARP